MAPDVQPGLPQAHSLLTCIGMGSPRSCKRRGKGDARFGKGWARGREERGTPQSAFMKLVDYGSREMT